RNVDGSICKRAILHGRRERADVAQANAIHAREPWEPVATTYEIRSEAADQVRALPSQIAQRAKVISLCCRTTDGYCICILEAERREPSYTVTRGESPRDLLIDCTRIPRKGICNRVVEDRDQPRSRVFGINVDSVLSECAERDFCGSEPRATCHRNTVCFEKLREHLAKQIRLATRLGCDNDGRLVRRARIRVWRWCDGNVGLAAQAIRETIPATRREREQQDSRKYEDHQCDPAARTAHGVGTRCADVALARAMSAAT